MRKLHCCFFLKTRQWGEALRDDTRNHKHTHLVLLPMKTQRVMLTKQPRPKTPSTGAVTQRKHQLYKRTKSNSAHRPSISLGRMRASFPHYRAMQALCSASAQALALLLRDARGWLLPPPPPPLPPPTSLKRAVWLKELFFIYFRPFS